MEVNRGGFTLAVVLVVAVNVAIVGLVIRSFPGPNAPAALTSAPARVAQQTAPPPAVQPLPTATVGSPLPPTDAPTPIPVATATPPPPTAPPVPAAAAPPSIPTPPTVAPLVQAAPPTPAIAPTPIPVAAAPSAPTALPAPTTAPPTAAPTKPAAPPPPQPTAAPAKPPAAPPPAAAGGIGPGTKVVGVDVQPGLYRSNNQGGGCYWARLKSLSGDLDDILANENAAGPAVVAISPTDKGFTSERCAPWVRATSPITANPNAAFGAGTYMVGTDIAPGTWRAEGGSGCYWARLKDFSGGPDAIIANDNTTGSAVVQIAASDAGFSSARCGTWTKAG